MSTKRLCIDSLGIALFVVLALCLRVPVFENYYLCLGYVVMMVYCYYFGAFSGVAVGTLGVVLYCVLTGGLRGMPGWAIGNLWIGLMVGMSCKQTAGIKCTLFRHIFIGMAIVLSVAAGILGIKSMVEAFLYGQPMIVRIVKNSYAFVADVVVMLASLPICVGLRRKIILKDK